MDEVKLEASNTTPGNGTVEKSLLPLALVTLELAGIAVFLWLGILASSIFADLLDLFFLPAFALVLVATVALVWKAWSEKRILVWILAFVHMGLLALFLLVGQAMHLGKMSHLPERYQRDLERIQERLGN
ncbi:MAG: hypothetical protein H6686_06245 [Fibrobacteria bacterium]|nr:hypothetical protein [Fibrobacteria bacterium]